MSLYTLSDTEHESGGIHRPVHITVRQVTDQGERTVAVIDENEDGTVVVHVEGESVVLRPKLPEGA
jgi:hypothetical protein